jgi:penicillin V acylase-like amidase (Ntn superfamily)
MCTGFLLQLADGTFIVARTMEFGMPQGWYRLSEIPAATSFGRWKSVHAILGVGASFQPLWIMDGFNSSGLYCGAFMFPHFAQYLPSASALSASASFASPFQGMLAEEVCSYILGTCSNLLQVKEKAQNIRVTHSLLRLPLHWWVVDTKSGQSLVLEPLTEGRLSVFVNSLGVCTNSPPFMWHVWNTYNYFPNRTYSRGMLVPLAVKAIPGSFSSPDRFIRAWLLRNQIEASGVSQRLSREENILNAFHLLHQFDIPKGITCDGGCETTDWSAVSVPQCGNYFYTTYSDLNIYCLNATAAFGHTAEQPSDSVCSRTLWIKICDVGGTKKKDVQDIARDTTYGPPSKHSVSNDPIGSCV